MNKLRKIIPYYWVIFTIYAFFRMRFGIFSRVDTIYEIVLIIIAIQACLKIKWTIIDRMICVFFVYTFFSCVVQGFSFELLNGWLRSMAVWICGYYIARDTVQNRYDIFEKMKFFFPFICILSIELYFHPTSWYLNYKLNYEGLSDHTIIELSRLSGFWEFPYFLSYGAFIYITYFSFKYFYLKNKMNPFAYLCFIIVTIAAFFAQQRVAIVFIVGIYLLFHFLILFSKKNSIKKFLLVDIFIILFISSFLVILKNMVSLDVYEYITERMFENTAESKLVTDRFEMFSYESSINDVFWGNGFGSHSRSSNSVISDNQYLNIYAELGFIGIILFYLPIILSLIKALLNYRICRFELCIILFFLAAMLGANPINSPDLHPFLFWYTLGLMNTYNYNKSQYLIHIQ